MPRPHILFLASWYPNRNAPALGNFIREHARAAALKYEVSVVYACSDEKLAEGKTELVKNEEAHLTEYILYYGKIRSSAPIVSQLKKRKAFRNAVQLGVDEAIKAKGQPTLLHLHVIWPMAIAALQVAKALNVPIVISEHWSGYLPEDGNYRGRAMKYYSKLLADRSAHVTVVSSRMEAAMKEHGLGKVFSLLPNTIDTQLFHPATSARNDGKFRLLHVSMLVDREKNISGILRVMKRLEQHPDIVLEIAGDGPERAAHEQHADELGLFGKTVFFSGFHRAEGIAEAMRHSDALLMFSHFEGMPVTIIEAQCCGLPVIASKVGAIPSMVNENQGLLVAPGDEAALEKAILQLKATRSHYSSAAIRERAAAHYSREAVAASLEKIYSSLLA